MCGVIVLPMFLRSFLMAFPSCSSFVFPTRLHCCRVVCRRSVTQPLLHPGLGSSYLFTSFKVVRSHSRRSMLLYMAKSPISKALQTPCLDCAEFQSSVVSVQTFPIKLRLFIGILLAPKTCLGSFPAYSCCLQTVRHCSIVMIMLTVQADPIVVTSYL